MIIQAAVLQGAATWPLTRHARLTSLTHRINTRRVAVHDATRVVDKELRTQHTWVDGAAAEAAAASSSFLRLVLCQSSSSLPSSSSSSSCSNAATSVRVACITNGGSTC